MCYQQHPGCDKDRVGAKLREAFRDKVPSFQQALCYNAMSLLEKLIYNNRINNKNHFEIPNLEKN